MCGLRVISMFIVHNVRIAQTSTQTPEYMALDSQFYMILKEIQDTSFFYMKKSWTCRPYTNAFFIAHHIGLPYLEWKINI